MSTEAVIAVCSFFVSFLAFILSMIVTIQGQRQKRLDNLIALHQFLLTDDLSTARQLIREGHVSISMKDQNIRRICSSFDFAASLVRHGVVERKPFTAYWGLALLNLRQKLDHIADDETGGVKVKDYYKDLFWLFDHSDLVQIKQ